MPYATEVEGYQGLVVAGPLLGDWLHQIVDEWLDDAGMITSVSYSNRGATYVGETLTATATITTFDAASGALEIDVAIVTRLVRVSLPVLSVLRCLWFRTNLWISLILR